MANGVQTARVYHFGAFTVDARTGELSQGGRRTPLRDQAFQVLLALLEQPGELVTREELARRLWGADTFVDFDRGLNKAVNHLREALGDAADNPTFIETLPRKGYRFVGQLLEPQALDVSITSMQPHKRKRFWLALPAAVALAAFAFAINLGSIRTRIMTRVHPGAPRISSIAVIPFENLSGDHDQEYFAD